jgi:hypothetical protein
MFYQAMTPQVTQMLNSVMTRLDEESNMGNMVEAGNSRV